MTKKVMGLCNILIDALTEIPSDQILVDHGIQKGFMTLVDESVQKKLLTITQNQSDVKTELGGSGLNVIRALALLGAETKFIGAIGQDNYADLVLQRFEELGIKAYMARSQSPTGCCTVLITPDGERTMNTYLGACLDTHMCEFDETSFADVAILHLTAYQWCLESQKETAIKAVKMAKAAGAKISFDLSDPGLVSAFHKDYDAFIRDHVDIVFANAEEALHWYSDDTGPLDHDQRDLVLEKVAIDLSAGVRTAVVKKGASGSIIMQPGMEVPLHAPAVFQAKVIDTTGAGDMYAGGYLWGLLKGLKPRDCANLGSMLASDVISRIGAALNPKVLEDVKALAQRLSATQSPSSSRDLSQP